MPQGSQQLGNTMAVANINNMGGSVEPADRAYQGTVGVGSRQADSPNTFQVCPTL